MDADGDAVLVCCLAADLCWSASGIFILVLQVSVREARVWGIASLLTARGALLMNARNAD